MVKKIVHILLTSIGLAGLLLVLYAFTHAPQAVQALPPRPEPTATAVAKPITGGQIQLVVDNGAGTEWTQVQWQDPDTGAWHDVIGWRGQLDDQTTKTWWVGAEDLGDGPFRWQVYDAPDGRLLLTSATFDLPQEARQTVTVTITLSTD